MPVLDQVSLHTQRLLLRPLGKADAPALFAIFSDPGVMRYWSSPPWESLEEAAATIARDLEAMNNGTHLRLGIERIEDHALIGTCILFDLNEQCRRAETGYALSPRAWGHGYMNEALAALFNYGFETLDLNRIEADVDPRNEASAKSLERLGFVKEGHLRERWIVGGETSDTALYGLLRSDWLATPRHT